MFYSEASQQGNCMIYLTNKNFNIFQKKEHDRERSRLGLNIPLQNKENNLENELNVTS